MKNLERLFAEKLLKIKAIKLQPANPFTWASGWKSPFYCDNRKTLSYPSLRNFVKIEITRLILERFGQVDAIAGVATGAIPQGALVADALNLPFVYVRSTPKDHGLERNRRFRYIDQIVRRHWRRAQLRFKEIGSIGRIRIRVYEDVGPRVFRNQSCQNLTFPKS